MTLATLDNWGEPSGYQIGQYLDSVLASKAKEKFISHLSHHLRTPLTAILGFSDLLLFQVSPEGREIAGYALEIRSAGKELLKIVSDVIAISSLLKSRDAFHLTHVDPLDIVERAVCLVQHVADTRDVGISISAPAHPLFVLADEEAMLQAVSHILENGVKFADEHSTVQVNFVSPSVGKVMLFVSNRGAHFSAARLDEMRLPFNDNDPYSTIAGRGIGLGIPLAAHLMNALGGKLRIRTVLGRGTVAGMLFRSDIGD